MSFRDFHGCLHLQMTVKVSMNGYGITRLLTFPVDLKKDKNGLIIILKEALQSSIAHTGSV